MQNNDTDFDELMKTLTDNFSILADEVQLLSDRKTILEHKLRFAHEQVSCQNHLISSYIPLCLYDALYIALDLELLSSDDRQLPCILTFWHTSHLLLAYHHGMNPLLTWSLFQYQLLADKYAPSDPEISSTLAKLQLPPELQLQSPDRAGFVPLPSRKHTASKQQTAVAIRDGRQAAHKLTVLRAAIRATAGGRSASGTSNSIRSNSLRASRRTSLSTVLEQDFTVPGKKSDLKCPYAPMANSKASMSQLSPVKYPVGTPTSDIHLAFPDIKDTTPHHSEDPICAAMYAETLPSQARSCAASASGSAPKCPIRFLDQHSPEEVARYFETHKHEIPRSHEICVKRYQRNENDIRKLDAKYGNLVSMIQGLGQKHQPMLPTEDAEDEEYLLEQERKSHERVEKWAKDVSADGVDHINGTEEHSPTDDDRESRFDRPMKEVRVGESPSRPWGISVPFDAQPVPDSRPVSPVQMTNSHGVPPTEPVAALTPQESASKPAGKCPFGFDQEAQQERPLPPPPPHIQPPPAGKPAGKCPFDRTKMQPPTSSSMPPPPKPPAELRETQMPPPPPTFLQPSDFSKAGGNGPSMIFTGPVFIGYPIEQAMAFMQQYQKTGGGTPTGTGSGLGL
jgi:hypothetical protein